jgi:hypothetical protein
MKLSPWINRVIENVIVAACTAIIVLVWQPTRDHRQEARDRIRAHEQPFLLWREQSKETWEKLTQQRPSLSDVQFNVNVRHGEISVRLPKLSDDDEIAVIRFILDNPLPAPVQLGRVGVTSK